MAFVDDVKAALEQGAHAGAAALSTAGKDLTGDVERFVIPHLADIAIQIASIAEKRAAGIFTDVTTKNLLDSEKDAIEVLVKTVVTLVVLEVQNLVNAIWAAVASVVNGKIGFTLLPT
jgi:Flp pilus assembly protein TadG